MKTKYLSWSEWCRRWPEIQALSKCGVTLEKMGEYFGGVTPQRMKQVIDRLTQEQEKLAEVPEAGGYVILQEHSLKPWISADALRRLADQALDKGWSMDEYLRLLLEKNR